MKIRRRLRKYVYVESEKDSAEILKKRVLSDVSFLNDLLLKLPGLEPLDRLIIQANSKYPMGFFVLLAALLAAVGFLVGNSFLLNFSYGIMFGIFGFLAPFAYLSRQKKMRMAKFKKQLPDGLDLIARSLKAGHALTGGISVAAEEFDDPLGPEFAEALDEINFGVSLQNAMKNLVKRIDCEEIKYFVVGVILQRETGGNLAELMTTLATLIRERFKFEGKVKTLTAEGRFSAIVLIALPFLLFGYLWFTSPNFLEPLLTEPVGRFMILMAIVMMILGALVMKKMVKIRV
jgi:tight adherence protein B